MTVNSLGFVTLDISTLCYTFVYALQIIHNLRENSIIGLSFLFHALLLIAATCDLCYGFVLINQWQYRLVSADVFLCLLVQHIHLFCVHRDNRSMLIKLYGLTCVVVFMFFSCFCAYFFSYKQNLIAITFGWLERFCYLIYVVPQIMKNFKNNGFSQSISPYYISLMLFLCLCDSISAWCLRWAAPSLYGAPVAFALHCLLFFQVMRYVKHTKCTGVSSG